MLRALSLGLFLAILWLLLSGHFEALLLSLGAVAVAVATFIAWRMRIIDEEGHPIQLGLGAINYWPWLGWEIVKANIAVARIILRRRMPISPSVIRLAASQASELGQVIYANSITLTPGTVTLAAEKGTLTVHALTREAALDLETGIMDRRVAAMAGSAGGGNSGRAGVH